MDIFTLQTLFLILLFCFFYHLFFKPKQLHSPSTHLTIPSPLSLPIVGHLHLLTNGMPHHTFAQLSNRLGPIIYLRLGQVPTVVISSAKLAAQVLKTHDHVFCNRPQLISAKYLSFGCSDVTFSCYGPYWRQARKICVSELLSGRRVNSFQFVRNEEVRRLLTRVLRGAKKEVNMSELFFGLANDILCRVAFGKRFMEDENGESQKRNLVDVLLETQALFAGFCVGDFFPKWEWVNRVSGYRKRLMNNLEDLRRVCDEIIQEHLSKNTSFDDHDSEREDFVDVLLRVQRRDDLDVPISDDNLKALVLDMFVAGTDTTSATLEWTLTELARHPEVMRKAQEEVRKFASTAGTVEESTLQHLHYIKSVIKETMRIHPPVPLLVPRESMEKSILDGYKIPAKTRVLINSYAISRDPKSWENPLQYNPERFMENEVDYRDQDFRFLPFGGGRRGCPGYAFGLATIEITLARLLYHFDWTFPDRVATDSMNLSEIFGLATRKKYALVLVPTVNKEYEFKLATSLPS